MNRAMYKNKPLSNEELNQIVPSAFATEPWVAQSDRYSFVPTSEIINAMRSAGFNPYSAMQSRSRIPGKQFFTKHMIRFRPENTNLTNIGDTVIEAVLVNSHDGTSQYELSLGAFRLACLNGMMVSEHVSDIVCVRHTGRIIDSVIQATNDILLSAPKVIEAIKTWKTIDLKPSEARILAEEAHSLRFDADAVAPEPTRLLQIRRSSDNGTDLWSTFNRIQENTVRGGLKVYSNNRRSRTRSVTGIAENTKLNRALWSLAEKMAELKTN